MGCPTVKKAFEDALNKDTLNNSDEFLTLDNGTLYNVTFGDIATQLGTTGSLTGKNGGGAVPILVGAAPDYEIRGIVGGNGITAQANISGSLTLNVNFANAGGASDGERVLQNTSGSQINVKRIKAGSGIGITSDSNSLVISNEQSTTSGKTVVVATIDDLPGAVSGVITLASNTNYQFVDNVSTANRFELGDNTIISNDDRRLAKLTYTGTGSMFTLGDGAQVVKDIAIECPNGSVFDNDNSTGSLTLRWVNFTEVNNMGTLGKGLTDIDHILIEEINGQGFVYEAATDVRLGFGPTTVESATDPSFIFLDLDNATFDSFSVTLVDILSTVSGQKFLKGVTGGGNINSTTIGYVSIVSIAGDMDVLDTITLDDPGYNFVGINKIKDTDPHCLVSLDASATTTISTIDTPVVVNGTFTENDSQLFTGSTAGRITYNGRRDDRSSITATVTAQAAASTSQYSFYIAKNGTVISASKVTADLTAGSPRAIPITWSESLSTSDYIEVFVENNDGTTNVNVDTLVIRVDG